MRTALVALVAVLASACGDHADALMNKKWVKQQALNVAYFGVTFDRAGNVVANGLKTRHTYRFDVKEAVWSDLGPTPGGAEIQPPFSDLKGNVYSLITGEAMPDAEWREDLFQLVGDGWEKVADLGKVGPHVVFDSDGAIFAARGVEREGEGSFVEIWRKPPGVEWERTMFAEASTLGLANAEVGLTSDNRGNLYLSTNTGIRSLSRDGTQLSMPFECDGKKLHLYCKGAIIHVDQRGEQTLLTYSAFDGTRLFRVAPGATRPVEVATGPAVIRGMVRWDRADNLYVETAEDYSGSGPARLVVLPAGSLEWKPIIDIPSYSHATAVRDDGEVFAFDPRDGELLWLK